MTMWMASLPVLFSRNDSERMCVSSLLKHDRVGRVGRIVRMLHGRLIVTSGQVRRNRVNKMVFEIRFNGLGALTTS